MELGVGSHGATPSKKYVSMFVLDNTCNNETIIDVALSLHLPALAVGDHLFVEMLRLAIQDIPDDSRRSEAESTFFFLSKSPSKMKWLLFERFQTMDGRDAVLDPQASLTAIEIRGDAGSSYAAAFFDKTATKRTLYGYVLEQMMRVKDVTPVQEKFFLLAVAMASTYLGAPSQLPDGFLSTKEVRVLSEDGLLHLEVTDDETSRCLQTVKMAFAFDDRQFVNAAIRYLGILAIAETPVIASWVANAKGEDRLKEIARIAASLPMREPGVFDHRLFLQKLQALK